MNEDGYNFGVRIADDSIYSEQEHNEKPKELFKRIISVIKDNNLQSNFSIYDIGCASGDLLGYTKSVFPQCQIFGTDISEKLITHAKKKYPEGKFQTATIEKENVTNDKKFDVVNLKGVLTIFDKPEPILMNCLSYVKKNGLLLVTNFFNPDPIDTLTRYRRADKENSPWESGWNIYSCHTIERILKNTNYNLDLKWHDFVMPFEIKRQNDPMRTWTTQVGDNDNTTINGACQILHLMILEIHVNDT